jgi:hypothetical protein
MACDALKKIVELRNVQNTSAQRLARCRWQYAVECLTSGYYHAKTAKMCSDAEKDSYSESMAVKIATWQDVIDRKEEAEKELSDLEKSLAGLDFDTMLLNFCNGRTREEIFGMGIEDTGGLATHLLFPAETRARKLEKEQMAIETVGWRHLKGAAIWRGRCRWENAPSSEVEESALEQFAKVYCTKTNVFMIFYHSKRLCFIPVLCDI